MTNEVSNASGRERGHKEVHLKAKGKRKKNEHIARQWQQRKKKKIEKGKKVKGDTRRTNEKELAAIRKRESFPSCTAGVVESCVALLFSCSVRESPGESEEGEGKTRERWTPHVCVCVCVCVCCCFFVACKCVCASPSVFVSFVEFVGAPSSAPRWSSSPQPHAESPNFF